MSNLIQPLRFYFSWELKFGWLSLFIIIVVSSCRNHQAHDICVVKSSPTHRLLQRKISRYLDALAATKSLIIMHSIRPLENTEGLDAMQRMHKCRPPPNR